MAINILDPKTWTVSDVDQTELIKRKVLGAMGNKIGELKHFRNTLNNCVSTGNPDYGAAIYLRDNNPEAFKIMEVSFVYPDNDQKASLIDKLDQILKIWSDVPNRFVNAEKISSLISEVENHLPKDAFGKYIHRSTIEIKVSGNAAWELYLNLRKTNECLARQLEIVSRQVRNSVEFDYSESDYEG